MLLCALVFSATVISAQDLPVDSFVPVNFVIADRVDGDLNKDGAEDCVLRVKGDIPSRDGLIIIFKNKDAYKLALKNYTCCALVTDYDEEYLQVDYNFVISNNRKCWGRII